MTQSIIFISIVLSGMLRGILAIALIHCFHQCKSISHKKMLVAGTLLGVAIALSSMWSTSELQTVYLEVFFLMLFARLFLQIAIRDSLMVVMLYEIAIRLGVFVLGVGCSVLCGDKAFLNPTHLYGQIPVWCIHILFVILFLYVTKASDMDAKKVFRITSAIAIIEMFAMVTISGLEFPWITNDTLTVWLIFSVVQIMCVLFLYIMYQRNVEQELVRLKEEQAKLLEKDYKTLNQAYEMNAKLFHDFHNHIGAIRQMLSNRKYEDAVDYLEALQEPIQGMTNTVWTGDDTVDYLINSKMATATANGITFDVEVEFPRNTNITGVDLCAIIGNLIDNALDATKQNEKQEDRRISFTIRRIHQMLVIKVENPYTVSVEQNEAGQLQTTKKEEGLHGWGIKSAQTAAEKYDGMVRTTCENNVFRAVATLSYEGVSRQ